MENQTENQPKKLNILLADDTHIGINLIEWGLKRFGYNVKRVNDGQEAVAYCRDNPDVDLVLLHIMIPPFEVAQEIRKFNKELAIIAIAPVGFFSREQVMENGCTDLIEKPFYPGLLTSMIKKYQPL
jgi:CheY-like chemotaxis protein